VKTRRRRVQQCEKLLLLGAHWELPGSSSQLRVLMAVWLILVLSFVEFLCRFWYDPYANICT
jgi:hypothetical protein